MSRSASGMTDVERESRSGILGDERDTGKHRQTSNSYRNDECASKDGKSRRAPNLAIDRCGLPEHRRNSTPPVSGFKEGMAGESIKTWSNYLAVALANRGENAGAQMGGAQDIDYRDAGFERRTIGLPGDRHDSAFGLDDRIESRQVAVGPV